MKIAISLLSLACLSMPALAGDYSALMKAHKFADAERLANSRLAQDPANAEALGAKIDVILAAGNQARLEEAATLGERCVAAHPQVALCHLAMGNALGAKAVANGIMSALGYAGTIRDAFKKAVELDPYNLEARMALLSYYLQAPAIVGGGAGKARTLIAQTAPLSQDGARVMQASLDLHDDKFAVAEAAIVAMPVSTVEEIADQQRDVLVSLGNAHTAAKRYADAERVLRLALERFGGSDSALYGLGRLQQAQGKHREAADSFDQVLAKAPRAGAWYRLGQSQQALGEKGKAASAYEHALATAGGLSKTMQADAQTQLKALRN